MELSIQWFIFTLVSNELTTLDYCVDLYESMGNPSLEDYAQQMLDLLSSQMDEDVINDLINQLQEILNFSLEQAQSGLSPEIFIGTQYEVTTVAEYDNNIGDEAQFINIEIFFTDTCP